MKLSKVKSLFKPLECLAFSAFFLIKSSTEGFFEECAGISSVCFLRFFVEITSKEIISGFLPLFRKAFLICSRYFFLIVLVIKEFLAPITAWSFSKDKSWVSANQVLKFAPWILGSISSSARMFFHNSFIFLFYNIFEFSTTQKTKEIKIWYNF